MRSGTSLREHFRWPLQRVARRELLEDDGIMSEKFVSLNPPQLQVLSWVRNGCPDGVYNDWSHRISARRLHNRGLVVAKGRGASWSATITDPGVHYVDHGTYGSDDASPTEIANEEGNQTSVAIQPTPSTTLQASATPQKRKSPQPKMPGPVDQMMAALHEADGHRLPTTILHPKMEAQEFAT